MRPKLYEGYPPKKTLPLLIVLLVISGLLHGCVGINNQTGFKATPIHGHELERQDILFDSTILFVGEIEKGNLDIIATSLDGQYIKNLTNHPALDIAPTLSPDGSRIAFASTRDGNIDIYTMDKYGNNVTRITDNSGNNTTPAWSTDGKFLAYTTTLDDNIGINIYSLENSQEFSLTIQDNTAALVALQHPAWLPNSEKIAFEGFSTEQNHSGIYSVNLDGSNLELLFDSPFDEVYPAWSNDGNLLAFASNMTGVTSNTYKLYILDMSRKEVRRLTDSQDRQVEQYPKWLPNDQEQVIYVNYGAQDSQEIVIASVNGDILHTIRVDGISIIGFPQLRVVK